MPGWCLPVLRKMSEPTLTGSQDAEKRTVSFDYIKSNFFRTARADGVWGGPNGHLDLVIAFYSERPPIPQHTVQEISKAGLGDEILGKRISRDSIVREIEFLVSMNLNVAISLRAWLDDQIKQMQAIASSTTAAKGGA